MKTYGFCPTCSAKLDFNMPYEKAVGATTDCGSCGELLLVRIYGLVRFHEYLHEKDPVWPKDGSGTQSLEA